MSSTFTWLDYSENDRRRALEAIDRFSERGVLDEIGIGVPRDALADLLFPGISTIQTRAGYFLFIPWIYQQAERSAAPGIAARVRRLEGKLVSALKAAGESHGVIGMEVGDRIKRPASSVYWQGLSVWRIRLRPGSQAQWHQRMDRGESSATRTLQTLGDEDGGSLTGAPAARWHGGLPSPPDGFPERASFALRRADAEYLRERIMASAPDSLLAHLVTEESRTAEATWPWTVPGIGRMSARLRDRLHHARCFSETMHGASLMYNLLLAEKRGSQILCERYRRQMSRWAVRLASRANALEQWDRGGFWCTVAQGNPRVATSTRLFVDRWLDLLLCRGDLSTVATCLADDLQARMLVCERERNLKRGLARLDNPRALERWSGESGAEPLTYRWQQARTIARDIVAGLQGEEGA